MRQWVMALLVIWSMMADALPVQGALVDNGDGTVSDTATGLMWQKATAPDAYTWEQALAYCEGLSLSVYTDWRLPNVNELQSLVDNSQVSPAIDPLLAPDTPSGRYWTSSPVSGSSSGAWSVIFSYGYVGSYIVSGSSYVRAVRTGQCTTAMPWMMLLLN